jgi:uncharacterized protein (DUF58 family)
MQRFTTPQLRTCVILSALAFSAAFVFRRPELIAVGLPFSLLLVVGLALARRPTLALRGGLARYRAIEGEELPLALTISSSTPTESVDLLVVVPEGLEATGDGNVRNIAIRRKRPRRVEVRLRCTRWGGYTIGPVVARAHDPLRLFAYEQIFDLREQLRVFPSAETIRMLVAPRDTQVFAGNRVARTRGTGIEFAELRPFVAGDALRDVNWRASARRGQTWINEHHPEQNSDVVLFLDAFAEVRESRGGTLDQAIRAGVSLASAYLEGRDRVGLVSFGGTLRWLRPGSGLLQRYRIIDALLETQLWFSYAWKDVAIVPPRALPPRALVVALSPLLDERTIAAFADLQKRSFDLVVIDVSPVPFASPTPSAEGQLASRLWLLRRERLRNRFAEVGVPVVEWREPEVLQTVLARIEGWRRRGRRASA